jgi:hypothetical protein
MSEHRLPTSGHHKTARPSDSSPPPLLDSAAAIWTFLRTEGGLDLEFHADMDGEIVTALKMKLGLHADADLDATLPDGSISIERFVEAFLTALGPYSKMMSELLAMFERAGGKHTDHALRAQFDFGHELSLEFDIAQFRDWLERIERARALIEVPMVNADRLWPLLQILHPKLPPNERNTPLDDRAVSDWLLEYRERRRWPASEPALPPSGDDTLDGQLQRTYGVWSSVVRVLRDFSPDRHELHSSYGQLQRTNVVRDGWPLGDLGAFDTDGWSGTMIETMYRLARSRITEVIEPLESFFGALPTITIERETVVRLLIEFLNLPVWKLRHELFSAWISTQIVKAAAAFSPRIHARDGLISFAFGGSHLATFDATRPAVHLWAELRSPVDVTLTKKEKHIQPDYTLIVDPITAENSAVVVVECKQYRRESRENFGHAIYKYAVGRPGAAIVLVNYGRASRKVLDGQPFTTEDHDRIHVFGEVRPGSPVLPELRRTIAEALAERSPVVEPELLTGAVELREALEAIELRWPAKCDLDLHLLLGSRHHVSFAERGALDREPFVALSGDEQHGGTEVITVGRVLPMRYRCYVHNYRPSVSIGMSAAHVTITLGRSTADLRTPLGGEGNYWHLFDYDGRAGSLTIVNAVTEEEPTFTR